MNVNELKPLAAGTEDDHLTWETSNAYHRKSFFNRYFLALEKAVRPVMLSHGLAKVLDAPCGDGSGTAFLAEQITARVVGVDLNPKSVDAARKKHPYCVTFECESIPDCIQPDLFNVILCMEFLEHVHPMVAEATVVKISQCLEAGGKAVFTSPRLRPRETHVGRSHHINEMSEQAFYYLIEEHFPMVERYSFDRYANIVSYTPDANLMVAVASKWPRSEVLVL